MWKFPDFYFSGFLACIVPDPLILNSDNTKNDLLKIYGWKLVIWAKFRKYYFKRSKKPTGLENLRVENKPRRAHFLILRTQFVKSLWKYILVSFKEYIHKRNQWKLQQSCFCVLNDYSFCNLRHMLLSLMQIHVISNKRYKH